MKKLFDLHIELDQDDATGLFVANSTIGSHSLTKYQSLHAATPKHALLNIIEKMNLDGLFRVLQTSSFLSRFPFVTDEEADENMKIAIKNLEEKYPLGG